MSRQADEPMNGAMEHVDPADWDGDPEDSEDIEDTEELDAVFDEQDTDTYRILAMLNQEHLEDVFGEDGTASDDEFPEFSQAFMDGMRTMVADHFGREAAEQFMTLNNNQINKKESHHQPKTVSETEKSMSQTVASTAGTEENLGAERPSKQHFHMSMLFSTWPRRVAAIVVAVGLIVGIYQGSVMATRLPTVAFGPGDTIDYSKVGSPEDIISNLDMTNYPKELEKVYVPGVVLDGYEEVERKEQLKYISMFYENDDGQWYQYRQMTVDANTFLDTKKGNWEEVAVKNYPGLYMNNDDVGALWWFDYQYAYQIQGDLTDAEMTTIAESLYELTE